MPDHASSEIARDRCAPARGKPETRLGIIAGTMVTAALTGNIGMGKSVVLGMFGELGAATLDADAIVSELLQNPAVLEKIKALLGPGVFDPDSGELDRKKVSDIIFHTDEKRREYEGLLHPLVYGRIKAGLSAIDAEVAVIEVPLLFETNRQGEFDCSVTVYADVSIALERLELEGMEKSDAARRLMSQMPIADKVRVSTFTVDNNGNLQMTGAQVRQIMRALKAMAAEK